MILSEDHDLIVVFIQNMIFENMIKFGKQSIII